MTAKDYAAISAQVAQLATRVQPNDRDPLAVTLNLCVYHLRTAASHLQRVAEFKVQQEKQEEAKP